MQILPYLQEYLSTFTPLLLEECAAHALREEEGDNCLATRVVVAEAEQVRWDRLLASLRVFRGTESFPSLKARRRATPPPPLSPPPLQIKQKGDFLCTRFVMDAALGASFVDNDLILITKDNPDMEAGWDGVTTKLHCIGLVNTATSRTPENGNY